MAGLVTWGRRAWVRLVWSPWEAWVRLVCRLLGERLASEAVRGTPLPPPRTCFLWEGRVFTPMPATGVRDQPQAPVTSHRRR